MNVHSRIVSILQEKAREEKEVLPQSESINMRELVHDTPTPTVVKSLRVPVEAPEPNLAYSAPIQDDMDDDLPMYSMKPSLSNKATRAPDQEEDAEDVEHTDIHISQSIHGVDEVDVLYVFHVHHTTHQVQLEKSADADMYTFPLLAKNAPAQQVKQLASDLQGTPIWEPHLKSAYILTEGNASSSSSSSMYEKTDTIQTKSIDGIPVHPSVWGFFGLYPEYAQTNVYSMLLVEDVLDILDYLIIHQLLESLAPYSMYVMKSDMMRFAQETQEAGDTMSIASYPSHALPITSIGYLDVSENVMDKIEEFLKEYNTTTVLCLRVFIQNRVLPLWIPLDR